MRRRISQAAVIICLAFLTSSSALVFEGGISNLGGIQLQEEVFLEKAKERGEEVTKWQPLLSENDRFWAQVEPVSHKGQLQEGKAGKFGPQLIDSRSRRLLLGIGKQPQNRGIFRTVPG